jgi:hypothetical protein
MGTLKSELYDKKMLRPKNCWFRVLFSIGSATWLSAPFKIVSSFGQLPMDQQALRPFKRAVGSDEAAEEEETSDVPQQTVAVSTPPIQNSNVCKINFLLNPSDQVVEPLTYVQ